MFKVEEDDWTLDLREGKGSVAKGVPSDKPDLTLTISDENFAKMVMGKLNPQQVCAVVACRASGAAAAHSVTGARVCVVSERRRRRRSSVRVD